MNPISARGFDAATLAHFASARSQQRVQAEIAVAVEKHNRDAQAQAASLLIETVPDVGRLVDVHA
ncbi:MAG: hypothetical protein OXR73_35410 [Myxococcales bacterium]|nr:hypothetical protein [Myxococcales bacterium]